MDGTGINTMKLYEVIGVALVGVWVYGMVRKSQHTALVTGVGANATNPQNQCTSVTPSAGVAASPSSPVLVDCNLPTMIPGIPARSSVAASSSQPTTTIDSLRKASCYGPAAPRVQQQPAPGITTETSFFSPGASTVAGEPSGLAIASPPPHMTPALCSGVINSASPIQQADNVLPDLSGSCGVELYINKKFPKYYETE